MLYPFKSVVASAALAGSLGLLFLAIGVVTYGRSGGKEPKSLPRAMGIGYLELDLQRTKDGVLIALHDDNLRRATNIADVVYCIYVIDVRLGSAKGPE